MNRTQRLLPLLFLALVCLPNARCQPVWEDIDSIRSGLGSDVPLSSPLHREYGRRDGLPSPWINDVVQTRDGFIWAATDNGLARYDGLRIQVYNRLNTPHLPHREIRVLCEDQESVLWIGTTHGLARFHSGKPGTIEIVDEIAADIIHEIYEDESGTLWVGTQDLTYVRERGGNFQPLPEAPCNVRAFCLDSAGTLWLGANSGLYKREGTKFRLVPHNRFLHRDDKSSGLHHLRVNVLFEDTRGDLWVGTNRILLRMHGGEFSDRQLDWDAQQVYDLLQTHDGTLYIAARFGLFRIDAQGNLRQASDRVSALCLYEDHDGKLWVGHGDNRGLHSFQTNYSQPFWNQSSVRCLYEERDGSLWLGTKDGAHHIGHGQNTYLGQEDGLPDATIQTIFPAGDGQLWFATRRGLVKYENQQVILNDVSVMTRNLNIGVGIQAACGDIWLGLAATGSCVIRDGELIEVGELQHGRSHWFLERDDGTLWIGHETGLYQASSLTITKIDVPALDTLQQPRLLCHAVAADGSLWIGTSNGLLLHRHGQFTAIPPDAGLHADNVERLATDQQGNLWFGGRDGLFYLDVEQIDRFVAKRAESLVSIRIEGFERFPPIGAFSQGFLAQDDALWILSENGLVKLPFEHVLRRPTTPQAKIETATVDGKSMSFDERFEYQSGNRRLEIHFAAPHFDNNWPLQVRYRLEGHDDHWNDAGERRSAEYTSLRPGNYRFLVNTRVANDPWPQSVTSMNISVKPRWWETWWFYILTPTALVLTTFGLTWQYLSQIRIRNLRLLDEIDKRLGAEQELQKSESSFRALAESTRAIPWEAEAEPLKFTYFGRQISEILGYSADECTRDGFWKANIVPQDLARVSKLYRRAIRKGQGYQTEFRVKSADGKIVHLNDVVHVVKQAGQVCKLGGFMIDVSEKRAAEESARSSLRQLARLDRIASMGEIAASIAHEVNQPLFAIVSNAQTALRLLSRELSSTPRLPVANSATRVLPNGQSLENEDVDTAANAAQPSESSFITPAGFMDASQSNMEIVKEALEDIVSDGNRASQIIDHIRSRVRKEPNQPELLDMNGVARDCADFAERELRRRGFTLRFQLSRNLPAVRASKVELHQVILNLLVNAMQACEAAVEPTAIVITTAIEGDQVRLSVRDQGVGIDDTKSQQLFDPFYTTKPQGTGIGLAVSRTIIEGCGGRIWATSNVDRGATFHFSLPAIREQSQ